MKRYFNNVSWLDFNMFQSGHRRYDQCSLGKWNDNKNVEEFFGKDKGLHDVTQPYNTDKVLVLKSV